MLINFILECVYIWCFNNLCDIFGLGIIISGQTGLDLNLTLPGFLTLLFITPLSRWRFNRNTSIFRDQGIFHVSVITIQISLKYKLHSTVFT